MERWQRFARAVMVLCMILLACAAICAVADAGAMTSAPRDKNRQRTGMSGKGVWFSVISFLTSVGWLVTSERETVRSSGLWVQAGRCAKTAKTPKQADKGGVVRKQRGFLPGLLGCAGRCAATAHNSDSDSAVCR